MEKKNNYPNHSYKSNKEWLRDVRKRWVAFDKQFRVSQTNVFDGSAYYPPEVYRWLSKIRQQKENMDKIMRKYYKNA